MTIALQPFRKYADFKGRARRKEYWLYAVFVIVLMMVLTFLDVLLDLIHYESGIGLLSGLFLLGTIIPSTAVVVRRLHDIDRTGWWYLFAFVPLIGVIVLLIFACTPGTKGSNRFGADPKAAEPEMMGVTA